MVIPGYDEDPARRANADSKTSRTSNTLGNTMWWVYT